MKNIYCHCLYYYQVYCFYQVCPLSDSTKETTKGVFTLLWEFCTSSNSHNEHLNFHPLYIQYHGIPFRWFPILEWYWKNCQKEHLSFQSQYFINPCAILLASSSTTLNPISRRVGWKVFLKCHLLDYHFLLPQLPELGLLILSSYNPGTTIISRYHNPPRVQDMIFFLQFPLYTTT